MLGLHWFGQVCVHARLERSLYIFVKCVRCQSDNRYLFRVCSIVGHTDYQTTANIYTHVRDEMLKKATVNMNEVFQQRTED